MDRFSVINHQSCCSTCKLILHYLKVDIALFESWYCTIWKLILHYLKAGTTLIKNWNDGPNGVKIVFALSLSHCQSHPILSTIFYFISYKISLFSPDILILLSLSHFKYHYYHFCHHYHYYYHYYNYYYHYYYHYYYNYRYYISIFFFLIIIIIHIIITTIIIT